MKKESKALNLAKCLIINEGWVSMPLDVAESIAMEAVNKGYIDAWQHLELDKEVFGNCITDKDGGNAGEVPVIDACEFLRKFASFSGTDEWGNHKSKITRCGAIDVLVDDIDEQSNE